MQTWQKLLHSANGALLGTVVGIVFLYLFIVSGLIAGLPLGLAAFGHTFFKIRRARIEMKRVIKEI